MATSVTLRIMFSFVMSCSTESPAREEAPRARAASVRSAPLKEPLSVNTTITIQQDAENSDSQCVDRSPIRSLATT
ncbi:hypothetical protein CDEF62S_02499 [Castellaniella defragrans]